MLRHISNACQMNRGAWEGGMWNVSSTNAATDKKPEEQAGASRQDRHHIWRPAGRRYCCQKETDMENWKSPVQKSGTGHPGIIGYVF